VRTEAERSRGASLGERCEEAKNGIGSTDREASNKGGVVAKTSCVKTNR
jgi:hypothetical protein